MTKAAQRAVDSIATYVLNQTVILGRERPEALEVIATILQKRASQLREERIERQLDDRGSELSHE